jgi:hypothetical protein
MNIGLNIMRFYYTELGKHTHVRVFVNGAKCGDLVFHNDEFFVFRSTALKLNNNEQKVEFKEMPDEPVIAAVTEEHEKAGII